MGSLKTYGLRFCGGTTTRRTSPTLSTSTSIGGSPRAGGAQYPRLQSIVARHTDDPAGIGNAAEDGSAIGVPERAQLPAEVLRERPLELQGSVFAPPDHAGEIGIDMPRHVATSRFIKGGSSRSRA